jgi:hypothetical protein
MGGGAIKFLYAPAPPYPTVWALKPPSWALEHKITYALSDLYSPVHNVLDACIPITWASGRGLGPGNLEFFGPQMHGTRLSARCHFSGPKKVKKLSISRAQPPPTCPCNGYARIQNIMHGAV